MVPVVFNQCHEQSFRSGPEAISVSSGRKWFMKTSLANDRNFLAQSFDGKGLVVRLIFCALLLRQRVPYFGSAHQVLILHVIQCQSPPSPSLFYISRSVWVFLPFAVHCLPCSHHCIYHTSVFRRSIDGMT